jgi:hypothetical protein
MSKYFSMHHRKSLVAVMAGFSMLLPLTSVNAQSTDGEVFTVYADDATANWPLWDCCGGSTPTVETDDAAHGSVAEFSVLGDPATVQGFDSRGAGTPYTASATGVFSFEMKVVTAPAAGTAWNLKLEDTGATDTGDINLNTSKEGLEPVTGEWQTYSFDVSTLASAGLDISAIDVIMMFPTWGQGGGAVYRIDNVQFTGDGGSTGGGDGGGDGSSSFSGGDLVIDIANGITFEGDEAAQAEWAAFENGDPSAPLEFVTNPNMVGNTTNGVAKLTPLAADPCCGKFAGVVTHTVQSFALSDSNALVKIWVHKDKISPVGVKFEKQNGDGFGSHGELTATNTLVNQWEQLTIDFSSQIGLPETDAITGIAIFPDMVDGRTTDTDIYLDEITFNPTSDLPPPPAAEAEALTLFADEAATGWDLWDCCAGSTPAVVMDDTDHGDVAEFSVLGDPATVQGFNSRTNGTPYNASAEGTFSFEMKVVTAAPDGTPWFMKMESQDVATNTGEVALSTSKEGVDPVVGQWQTYTFDNATLVSLGLDITKIDVVMIFPAWGQGAGAVYRVDNVIFTAPSNPDPDPDPTPSGLTVFGDEVKDGWPLWDCCAGSTPTVEMDDADHGNVAEFSVLGDPATVQGFNSRTVGMLYDASGDDTFSFEMKVVTAAADGTPWFMKMESQDVATNTGDVALNTSKEGVDPVTGEWQTYTFDVAALAAAGLDITKIDVVMIFPAWGQGAGAVYRVDNVLFGAGDPTTVPDPDPTLYSGQLHVLPDTNDDGVSELGLLKVDTTESTVTLEILNGKDRAAMHSVVWVDRYDDASISVHIMPDMNDNGVDEVALFGIQDGEGNEGKAQAFVRDLMTGNKVGATVNWVANWTDIMPIVMADMNGDGLSEIAIQGNFKEGNRPQLVVKAGGTNTIMDTYSYPDLFVTPYYNQHSDINGDGFPEISTFGRLSKNNKIQVKIASGIDAGTKSPAYNFPDKWDDISWHRLDDSNADGQDDWGLFGTLREDGRPQLVNKDGTSPMGALRIFAWPAEMQDAKFFVVPDMNNDGVSEVAAAGVRSNNGRFQFQVQDGTDRNMVLANHNLNLNLSSVTYHVLPDFNADEMAEIGFLGMNASGEYELIIRHGDTANGEYSTHNLGSDWESAPTVTSLGDTDDDGSPDLMAYGQNANGDQLVMMDL